MTTDETSGHFAEDEEQLGLYVLGKLSRTERSAAELHLASCSACREAVRKEQLLAEGGKHLGRERLKASLRERIDTHARSKVEWPKILSAAAVIGIVVGIGIYSDWFSTGHIPEDRALKTSTPAESGKIHRADSVLSAAPADEQRRNEIQANESAAKSLQNGKGGISQNAGAGGPAEKQRAADAGVTSRIATPSAAASGAAPPNARRDKAAFAAEENGHYWIEGVLISPPPAGLKKTDALARSEEAAQRREIAESKDKKLLDEVSSPLSHFRVIRHSLSDLPPGHLFSKGSQGIPTLVEQKGDTTLFTLFVGSTRPEADDRRMDVLPAGPDSVVVRWGDRTIGLHLLPVRPARQK